MREEEFTRGREKIKERAPRDEMQTQTRRGLHRILRTHPSSGRRLLGDDYLGKRKKRTKRCACEGNNIFLLLLKARSPPAPSKYYRL